jgi:hypothetical protein
VDKYGRSVTQSSSAIGARTLYGSYSGTESTGARSLYGSYSGNEGNGGNNNGIGGYVGYGGVYGSHSGNGETQWVTQTLSPGVPRVVSRCRLKWLLCQARCAGRRRMPRGTCAMCARTKRCRVACERG